MEYFRIGEFCKEFGISPETLKYYDRQGILAPIWKDESSYRYYGGFQSVHLAEYYALTQIGFTLNEAKDLLKYASLQEFIVKFQEKYDKRQEEQKRQEEISKSLLKKLNALRCVKESQNWYIEWIPDSCFCTSNGKKGDNYTWWKDGLVLPEIWQSARLCSNEKQELQIDFQTQRWGCFISAEKRNLFSNKWKIESIQGGRYLIHYNSIPAEYDNEKKLSDKVWDFSSSLQLIQKHNLTPRGDLYQCRLCLTQEENGAWVHMMTYIPLQ